MAEVTVPDYVAAPRRRTRVYDQEQQNTSAVIAALVNLVAPPGTYLPTSATTEPEGDGWKLCNGQALDKDDYPRLYAIYGGAFGETSTTFNLPDLRGRMLMGTGAGGAPSLNATGGAASVTLTVGQLPSHTHTLTDPGHTHTFTGTPHNHAITDPGHSHTDGTNGSTTVDAGVGAAAAFDGSGSTSSETTGITIDNETAGGSNSSETTGITIAATGSGDSVPIIPPVLGINWLVRA